MKLEEFLFYNIDTGSQIVKWSQRLSPQKIVLFGKSGNGKTLLAEIIAEMLNANLFRITPDNADCINSYHECISGLKLKHLQDDRNQKVVLVDDIDNFRIKQHFYDLSKICTYPIIYTCADYPPEELRRGTLVLELKRPRTSEIFKLLKSKNVQHHSEDVLQQIAKQSPSVRSALNSLHTGCVNSTLIKRTNILDKRNQLTARCLIEPFDLALLNFCTRNLNYFTDDGFAVLERFVVYDVALKATFQPSIDSFIVNNMLEPIERVQWFESNSHKKKVKKNQKEIKRNQKTAKQQVVAKPKYIYKPLNKPKNI